MCLACPEAINNQQLAEKFNNVAFVRLSLSGSWNGCFRIVEDFLLLPW